MKFRLFNTTFCVSFFPNRDKWTQEKTQTKIYEPAMTQEPYLYNLRCRGESMLPTLPAEEHSYTYLSYTSSKSEMEVGDIVDIYTERITKRIFAIGPACIYNSRTNDFDEVPEGYVYVQGDNPNKSYDSRWFGPIHKNEIKGKLVGYRFEDMSAVENQRKMRVFEIMMSRK
ncbi:hypothetical protein L596_028306 [Steinernema carpocapsae]|uniref:Peptidase S26 domain-containing protein n=1 Tax=Steinernema carpocapsae TaxID=34508 RepID=A0A4V5ZXV5_STECR|nr:hypothetical protein L596_028306 [Steinernema carpocapsae]